MLKSSKDIRYKGYKLFFKISKAYYKEYYSLYFLAILFNIIYY